MPRRQIQNIVFSESLIGDFKGKQFSICGILRRVRTVPRWPHLPRSRTPSRSKLGSIAFAAASAVGKSPVREYPRSPSNFPELESLASSCHPNQPRMQPHAGASRLLRIPIPLQCIEPPEERHFDESSTVDEDAFEVSIDPALKRDPFVAPPFTTKQGQYLAFVHNYTKIHRCPPAESDLPASPSGDPRYDQDPGAQRAHRKTTWASALHSPPCRTGVPAAIEVARALKPTTGEASAGVPQFRRL